MGQLWKVRYTINYTSSNFNKDNTFDDNVMYIHLNNESNFLSSDVLDALGFIVFTNKGKDLKTKILSAEYLGEVYT